MPVSLDLLVTSVATQLMSANAADAAEVSRRVLATLVEYFDVDVSFLRHNDHGIRASMLIAEWPPRPGYPGPGPAGRRVLRRRRPRFRALSEHRKKPSVFRPEPATDEYQRTDRRRQRRSRHVDGSGAAVCRVT